MTVSDPMSSANAFEPEPGNAADNTGANAAEKGEIISALRKAIRGDQLDADQGAAQSAAGASDDAAVWVRAAPSASSSAVPATSGATPATSTPAASTPAVDADASADTDAVQDSPCEDADVFDRLQASLDALRSVWDTSITPLPGTLEDQLDSTPEPDLLTLLDSVHAVRRQTDALLTVIAHEISTRCARSLGTNRLSFQHGARSAAHFLADRLDLDHRDAATLVTVGDSIIGDRGLTGHRTPPATEHVATALRAGELGLAHARDIVHLTRRLAPNSHVDPDALAKGEELLVDTALAGLPRTEFKEAITRVEAYLDPDGRKPALDEQHRKCSMTFRSMPSGMVHVNGKFDAVGGAMLKHAVDGVVTGELRSSRGHNHPDDPTTVAIDDTAAAFHNTEANTVADAIDTGTGPEFRPIDPRDRPEIPARDMVHSDGRSIPQMNADALVTIAKHLIGCDLSKLPGPSTTLVVRIDVDAVVPPSHYYGPQRDNEPSRTRESGSETGTASTPAAPTGNAPDTDTTWPGTAFREHNSDSGLAWIDGHTIIDVATARKLAAAAGIIPIVLGTDCAVLDLGREARAFTRYQRLALVERDGGCAFCGLPPGMTEAHHIRYWTAHHGNTDLNNGILLCTSCHHRIHDSWEIRIVHHPDASPEEKKRGGGTVWFIPPVRVDIHQTPRLGGRKRFDPVFRQANPPVPVPGYEHTNWVSTYDRYTFDG